MKTRILSIFLTSLATLSFAQKDTVTERQSGINITSSISGYAYGINLNPNFTYRLHRHVLSIGPSILLFQGYFDGDNVVAKLTGAQAVYQFYPNPKQNTINFFFQYDCIYQHFVDKGISWKNVDNTLEQYLGYGFKINFSRHLYLNQSMGLGLNYSHRKTVFDSRFANTDKKYAELSGIFKFGIGYQFN